MRRVRRRLVETMVPLLLLTLAVPALGAVLNKKARLREGPTRESTLLDWVDTGTSVSVIGEQAGWYNVVLPDGRQGFIWGEHLDQIEVPADSGAPRAATPAPAAAATPQAPRPATLQDDLQALRTQLEGYSREGGLVAKADLDRLVDRVDRLAAEQQALRESLDESVFTGMRTPVDGSAIAGGAFLTIGGILGWALARLSQRRRDRRSRIRL
ncbi:MAG TPA: SH3 domain-containing protein [Candidatus Limnocylindria bacterium]|nr:SH3 domain-containing protein [Candidatus Limnocylindria bacterium]